MIKDNKLWSFYYNQYYDLKDKLQEKENHLQTLNIWYNNERDDRSRKGILKDIKSVELKIKEIKNKMANIKNEAHLKDSMEMLKLMGFTVDAEYTTSIEKGKLGLWNWYVHKNGTIVAGGTSNTESEARAQANAHLKKESHSKDSCGEKVYTKGESTEDQCKDGGPGSGIKGHTGGEPMARLSKKWTPENINHIMRNPHLYREEVVEEAARKSLENKGLLKKAKDDDATEMGSFEELGQNHETEAMEPQEHPTLAQDDSMISEVLNPLKESWSKIKELSTEDGDIILPQHEAKDEKFEIIYSTGKWPNEVKTYKEIFNAPYEEAKKMAEGKKRGDYYRLVQVTKVKDAIPTDWDVGLFDGKWYITRNGRKVKGPFSSMKAAENYLRNSKMYLEDVNIKDSARLIESMRILQLSGLTTDADEQWITMNGAHVKVEEGESKASATKKFIKEKGENPASKKSGETKENSSLDIDEGDLKEIRSLSEEEIEDKYGSEFGAYKDKITSRLKKSGQYPDMKEYDKISDKMFDLRKEGKKDTDEYKELERKKKEWNKSFNKIEKSVEAKAYELCSKKEKERLDEIHSYFKKNPAPKWAN